MGPVKFGACDNSIAGIGIIKFPSSAATYLGEYQLVLVNVHSVALAGLDVLSGFTANKPLSC